MKKLILVALFLLLSVTISGCRSEENITPLNGAVQQNDEGDRQAVASLVQNFGSKLKMVSLLAPQDIVGKSMQENYGSLVTPGLLAKWQGDPQNAPGRMVSSPWPERIDIKTNQKIDVGTYEVTGEIIEISSAEQAGGGVAARRPITLIVKKAHDSWLIDSVTLGAYVGTNSTIYKNSQYGFTFALPKSWENYSIVIDKWEGTAVAGAQSGKIVEIGQIIKIRHPQWTAKEPRQDIPIMIFTPDQWNLLQKAEISVGAAPIPPSELGRNNKYIFALPARYNYAFPAGFEEVEQILQGHPLQPTELL
ncbi:MAG: hypothetical protein A4E53_02827 [Pelotomaculum sp. PtaB.Bin104]|nr:MAG: hypothetical protein A4E53_02827 [Pelotomaculum sp. PtaB.Bin104]